MRPSSASSCSSASPRSELQTPPTSSLINLSSSESKLAELTYPYPTSLNTRPVSATSSDSICFSSHIMISAFQQQTLEVPIASGRLVPRPISPDCLSISSINLLPSPVIALRTKCFQKDASSNATAGENFLCSVELSSNDRIPLLLDPFKGMYRARLTNPKLRMALNLLPRSTGVLLESSVLAAVNDGGREKTGPSGMCQSES
uniref:Uncharacterized protein n=1 Tax=Rhodosorus marinus TaxID=101924 RepID=A0A7S2ZA74_9RHOD|mmetsp:Transcript_1171/g.3388  ORF Transcript_1171/g.3388 Transcript_1171/m.3388 type:complete len:203 (+) Transcript_1171:868-1476(+)